jgi:hypothetical protein
LGKTKTEVIQLGTLNPSSSKPGQQELPRGPASPPPCPWLIRRFFLRGPDCIDT